MRKALMLCLCAFAVVFTAGHAMAQGNYAAAIDGTKPFADAGVPETINVGDQIMFDVYLENAPGTATSGGAWINFKNFADKISYVSAGRALTTGSEGVTGPWDPSAGGITDEPNGLPGQLQIVVGQPAGAAPDGDGDIIVARVTLQCTAVGDVNIVLRTIPGFGTWGPTTEGYDDAAILAATPNPTLVVSQVGGPVCGDDIIESPEVCDGTNLGGETCVSQGFDDGDLACSADCTSLDTSGCFNIVEECGNGTIDPGEACDGTNLGGETCQSQGFDDGDLACSADCTSLDTSGCFNIVEDCGNGTIDPGEACDGTNLGGETCVSQGFDDGDLACSADCTSLDTSGCFNIVEDCGNGTIDPGEACDGTNLGGETCVSQGFDDGDLACSADCTSLDTSGCFNIVEECGNGTIDPGEACDGDNLGGETCVSQGFDDGDLACSADCTSLDTSGCFNIVEECGNGTIDPGEVCDGSDLGGETCQSQGFDAGDLACSADCDSFDRSGCFFEEGDCGNGIIDFGEECDGGNLGCATCESLGYDGGVLSCYEDCVTNRTGCFITQSSDTRVMFGYDAMDRTGIYINDYAGLNQCGRNRSLNECVCDPTCRWGDGECFDINAGTLRLFGEDGLGAAFPYTDAAGPIDPTSDEAPEKDFLTWNPAYMPEAGPGSTEFYRRAIVVNGNDAREKVFLRQWYVPRYQEPRGRVWIEPFDEYEYSRDIVKEYTFMLLDTNNQPYPGNAGSTSFIFPAAYSNEDQIGLDGWDVDGDGEDDPTLVNGVDEGSKTIDIGTGQLRLQSDNEDGDFPTEVEFLDHRAEITFVGSSITESWAMVRIYYPSAFNAEDPIGASEFVMQIGDTLVAGRHEVNVSSTAEPIPVLKPWYLKLIAVDIKTKPFTAIVKVGRLVQEGESFFSDGAEYDVAKIHTPGGRLQYITLRNPLPKDRLVHLPSLTVWKAQVKAGEAFPMLPPFNKEHAVIDDISGSVTASCSFPVVTGVCPVVERWVLQSYEERFTTKLCEILEGLGWNSLDIKTLPDFYTELILPEQVDAQGRPGDYLLTSSFRAPNSDNARVSFYYDANLLDGGLTDIYINDGLRVYGEDSKDAAFPYSDPVGPIDPTSDEAPEKDFITFNPAIMPDAGLGSTQFYREALMVNGNDANEKVFLRQWYVPDYPEPKGNVWTNQETVYTADIVKEYTFMLLDPSNQPYPGSAGSTSFIFPTAYSNQDQIGLDGWDVDGDGEDDPTLLNEVGSDYIDIGTGQHRLQGIDTDPDNFPSDIEFLDHKAEIDFVGSSQGVSWINVTIYYPSAFGDNDQIGASEFVMAPGDKLLAGRHVVELGDDPEPIMMPWYLELIAVDIYTHPYTAIVKVGRLLQEEESFFSDGAEYDVAKIQTEGDDLLYITLRNPLPKGDGVVELPRLTVWKEKIPRRESIPMLPPFNKIHAVIDDIGLTQNDDCEDCGCQFPVVTDVAPVVESWIEETTEPRFTTKLCEILDGLGWRDQTFRTMPNAYTEFDLPRQEDAEISCRGEEGDVTPGDYLLTSSWVLQDGGDEPPEPPKTYCVSGTVSDPQGNSIAGVMITSDGGSASTGVNGGYEICGLTSGIYTLSPNSGAYAFEPESQSVPISSSDVTGVDFTGTAVNNGSGPFTISGRVAAIDSQDPLSGVTVDVMLQIGGGAVGSAQTGTDGTYVITGIPDGGDYRVTPTKDDCEFEPGHTAINNLTADQTAVNFTGDCEEDSTPGPDDPSVAEISIRQEYLIRSKWFILPAFVTIKGNNTNFNASTKITFDPKNAVLKLLQRAVDEENITCFVLVMPSWLAVADAQQVALKVTTGPEEAGSAVDIKMLSTVLAGE